jgi:hypothetical protein
MTGSPKPQAYAGDQQLLGASEITKNLHSL